LSNYDIVLEKINKTNEYIELEKEIEKKVGKK